MLLLVLKLTIYREMATWMARLCIVYVEHWNGFEIIFLFPRYIAPIAGFVGHWHYLSSVATELLWKCEAIFCSPLAVSLLLCSGDPCEMNPSEYPKDESLCSTIGLIEIKKNLVLTSTYISKRQRKAPMYLEAHNYGTSSLVKKLVTKHPGGIRQSLRESWNLTEISLKKFAG